jgi:hypothetical protein
MGDAIEQPPVRCFISYRRDDDLAFGGVVDRLKKDLTGRFEAITGRRIEVFVDRDDIGWGEEWRERIYDSIKFATFFIPVLTARYFDSQSCREEFLAFYNNARELGVTELITPLVLAGMEKLQAAEDSEPAALAMKLQCMIIADDYLEGFDSAAWNKKVNLMVKSLDSSLTRAESSLAAGEVRLGLELPKPAASLSNGDDDSSLDGVELLEVQSRVDGLNLRLPDTLGRFQQFTELLMSTLDEEFFSKNEAQKKVIALNLAKEISKPAEDFREAAAALQSETSELDAQLRMIIKEFASMSSVEGRSMLDSLIGGIQLDGIETVRGGMAKVSDMFKMASMMNVNLRRAIQPAQKGVRSLNATLDIIDQWRDFGGAGQSSRGGD